MRPGWTRCGLRGTAVCAALLLLLACPAGGQIPPKMNYQVMLTNDMDEPLPDQDVTLHFSIFDVFEGGLPLWSEGQDAHTNSIGVVSVVLGAVNPIDIDFDIPLWLEVEVDGEVLSPRRELTAAPYAGHAAIADNSDRLGDIEASEYALREDLFVPGTINDPSNPVDWTMLKNVPTDFADGIDNEGGGAGDGHSLDADDGDPVDALYVDSGGNVQIGEHGDARTLFVGGTHVNNASVGLADEYQGGVVTLRDETGMLQSVLMTDTSTGGGAYLSLFRNDSTDEGFVLDGNHGGTEEPRMDITGSSRSAVFDMGEEGDSSVELPSEAVNSSEMHDEPGVASIQADGWIILSQGNVTTVASRTMTTVPADGFVFVMGTAQVEMDNSVSQPHYAMFGISHLVNAWSSQAQETVIELPGGLPGAWYNFHVAVHGLFEVSAGSVTFHLNALEIDGVCAVRGRQLTLLYFPTSYGPVDVTDEPAGAVRSH